ncbi:hypothetical protein ZIOFF_012926 [Zingiber officinale]|uniref:Uncharacterized protein n=1 Tax=Zingiber officinale TaxID=94328 RepID=A0A8J5HAY4_ZINOF|nr:hypothetical protein ZIOFF_012926 [Zingiber officinale]
MPSVCRNGGYGECFSIKRALSGPLDDCLKLLRGQWDEQKLVGLLTSKICHGDDTTAVLKVYDAVGACFLQRLILTGMGKGSGGFGSAEDKEPYSRLSITLLTALCRVPEIASYEEMVSKVPLVAEIVTKSWSKSLTLVAVASDSGRAKFYQPGVNYLLLLLWMQWESRAYYEAKAQEKHHRELGGQIYHVDDLAEVVAEGRAMKKKRSVRPIKGPASVPSFRKSDPPLAGEIYLILKDITPEKYCQMRERELGITPQATSHSLPLPHVPTKSEALGIGQMSSPVDAEQRYPSNLASLRLEAANGQRRLNPFLEEQLKYYKEYLIPSMSILKLMECSTFFDRKVSHPPCNISIALQEKG